MNTCNHNSASEEIIALKAGAAIEKLRECGLLAFWISQQRQFMANIRKVNIKAIVMDYDGTAYAGGQLNNALPDTEMVALLVELLERGIYLGFASGRGESLRSALRAALPKTLWPRVYAAYQDGAECARLDDDAVPLPYEKKREHSALMLAREKLEWIFAAWPDGPYMRAENKLLGVYGAVEMGKFIFSACCGVAVPLGLKVFHGGRMTDITLPDVSKRNLRSLMPAGQDEILSVGDAGAWPGNDCELLDNPLGVSVGSMSANPACCWRITRETGIESTRRILKAILKSEGEIWEI